MCEKCGLAAGVMFTADSPGTPAHVDLNSTPSACLVLFLTDCEFFVSG